MESMQRIESSVGRQFTPLHLVLPLLLWLLGSCSTAPVSDCEPGIPCIPSHGPHPVLSDYGLFKGNLKYLEPIDALLPYDLNTELFSDYALKHRMIYIPEGKSIHYKSGQKLDFPAGSVLVKNFFYYRDLRNQALGRTLLETRLLILYDDGWTAETYIWNQEQTEAHLHRVGSSRSIAWSDAHGVNRSVNYLIPGVNDCSNCHAGNKKLAPLGPSASNLNKQYAYKDGTENQLVKWQQKGFLTGDVDPAAMPKLPVWDDPATGSPGLRARAYLDVNCSSCHNPSGSASNTAMFLEYEQENTFHLGVCKSPVAAGAGTGGRKYGIVPGLPDESILLYRMESNQPKVRMPEIGRTLVHEEAVGLIRQWIESLDLPGCAGS
jgi:uncharacterized repeat protein (TIGR03806 family)